MTLVRTSVCTDCCCFASLHVCHAHLVLLLLLPDNETATELNLVCFFQWNTLANSLIMFAVVLTGLSLFFCASFSRRRSRTKLSFDLPRQIGNLPSFFAPGVWDYIKNEAKRQHQRDMLLASMSTAQRSPPDADAAAALDSMVWRPPCPPWSKAEHLRLAWHRKHFRTLVFTGVATLNARVQQALQLSLSGASSDGARSDEPIIRQRTGVPRRSQRDYNLHCSWTVPDQYDIDIHSVMEAVLLAQDNMPKRLSPTSLRVTEERLLWLQTFLLQARYV